MIKKEELKRLIKDAMDKEEKSIPIYMNHLRTAVFWIGLKDKDVKKVKDAFVDLASKSAGHKKVLEELLKKIEGSPKDAF